MVSPCEPAGCIGLDIVPGQGNLFFSPNFKLFILYWGKPKELMLLNCDAGEDSWESLAQQGNQTKILKEINTKYSLKGLRLKLKLQYFGQLIWRADSSEKTLMLGKVEFKEGKGTAEDEMVGWHHWLNGLQLSKLREMVMNWEAWRAVVPGIAKSQTWASDWRIAD